MVFLLDKMGHSGVLRCGIQEEDKGEVTQGNNSFELSMGFLKLRSVRRPGGDADRQVDGCVDQE